MASCHGVGILGIYTPPSATRIRVGWQEKGQPPGEGWSASVIRMKGRYAIQDCKLQGITHG